MGSTFDAGVKKIAKDDHKLAANDNSNKALAAKALNDISKMMQPQHNVSVPDKIEGSKKA